MMGQFRGGSSFYIALIALHFTATPKKINVPNAFYIKILIFTGASPMAQQVKNLPVI